MPKHWTRSQTIAKAVRRISTRSSGPSGRHARRRRHWSNWPDRADRGKVWPEFSEWSCSACHHDLRDDSARQRRLAEEQGLSGRLIAWDTWNHFMSRDHIDELSRAFESDAQSAAANPKESAADRRRNATTLPQPSKGK